MSNAMVVDLFVEDRAHEEFLKAMINRLALEENKPVTLRIRSARGGHGRVLTEFSLYQRGVKGGIAGMTIPDLLIVAVDANCKRLSAARKEIAEKIEPSFREKTVIACPDPHVERWYLADPDSFIKVVGGRPKLKRKKCDRDHYKAILSRAVVDAGHPLTLGGIEFARELVEAMDLYRASKTDRALKDFLQDTRHAILRTGLTERPIGGQ